MGLVALYSPHQHHLSVKIFAQQLSHSAAHTGGSTQQQSAASYWTSLLILQTPAHVRLCVGTNSIKAREKNGIF